MEKFCPESHTNVLVKGWSSCFQNPAYYLGTLMSSSTVSASRSVSSHKIGIFSCWIRISFCSYSGQTLQQNSRCWCSWPPPPSGKNARIWGLQGDKYTRSRNVTYDSSTVMEKSTLSKKSFQEVLSKKKKILSTTNVRNNVKGIHYLKRFPLCCGGNAEDVESRALCSAGHFTNTTILVTLPLNY